MSRQKTGSAAHGFSAEDVARIDSWIVEIAAKHLGGVAPEEANAEWRVGNNRRLVIHRNGCWHDFVDETTGHGALSLLAHLHHDDADAALEAAQGLAGPTQGRRAARPRRWRRRGRRDAEAIAADDAWRDGVYRNAVALRGGDRRHAGGRPT